MTQATGKCSKSGGAMEPGFVLDKAHSNLENTQEWLEGRPEWSNWTGLKTKGRDRFPVTTFRCDRCGFLESFAGPA